jgi:D5 N terminal like
MLITEYLSLKNVQWFPIILDVKAIQPEELQYGEVKFMKDLLPVNHALYNHEKLSKEGKVYISNRPEMTDFDTLPPQEIIKRQNLLLVPAWKKRFNYIAMSTDDLKHIDLDCPEYNEEYKSLLKTHPYYKSATKSYGKHILIQSLNISPAKRTDLINDVSVGKKTDVELLAGQWAYCKVDAIVENADCADLTFDFMPFLVAKTKKNKEIIADDANPSEKYRKLFEIIRFGEKAMVDVKKNHHDKFIRLCDCMKTNGLTENDWLSFIKRNNLNPDIEKLNLFPKMKGTTSIYYAIGLAKTTNPEEFRIWASTYGTYLTITVLQQGENDVAKFISKTLIHTLKTCKNEWWWFNPSTSLWITLKNPTAIVINSIQSAINESIFINEYHISKTLPSSEEYKKLIDVREQLHNFYRNATKSSYSSQVIKCLQTYLMETDFVQKLDVNIGKLAFKNGIIDLESKTFRKGIEYEDFITQTIPYDYAESGTDFVRGILKKILNNNDEHLEYFLSIIGYSFIGEAELDKANYFNIDKTMGGRGDNGKTFYFDVLTELAPNYVYRSSSSLIDTKNTKVHKQMAMTKGKRIVWLEELPKEQNINATLVKQIGDGKKFENEVMFGTSEEINIMFKMFVLSNHIPKIDPDETAVYNRYRQISYNSHFDRTGTRKTEIPEQLLFIADPNLSRKVKEEHFDEVFNLIVEYAHEFYKRGKKLPSIPLQFLEDTKETQNKNDEFGLWFENNIDICEYARLSDKILVEVCGMTQNATREGMKRKGYSYNKELKGMGKDENDKYYKGGYVGVSFKPMQSEDQDDDSRHKQCLLKK